MSRRVNITLCGGTFVLSGGFPAGIGTRMLTLSVLALLYNPVQAASNAWNPVCSSAADPSVWFIFSATDATATPLPEYDCKGLFFDTTACPTTLGLGKIRATGTDTDGYSTYELRYLPAGALTTIITFLNQPGGGVLYSAPKPVAASAGSSQPPAQPEDLLALFMQQRNKASAATSGVTLHLWTCPDIPFDVSESLLAPTGMGLVRHLGKVSGY